METRNATAAGGDTPKAEEAGAGAGESAAEDSPMREKPTRTAMRANAKKLLEAIVVRVSSSLRERERPRYFFAFGEYGRSVRGGEFIGERRMTGSGQLLPEMTAWNQRHDSWLSRAHRYFLCGFNFLWAYGNAPGF